MRENGYHPITVSTGGWLNGSVTGEYLYKDHQFRAGGHSWNWTTEGKVKISLRNLFYLSHGKLQARF